MDRDWGSKPGSAGVASATQANVDRRNRLASLALETVDLNKVPRPVGFLFCVCSCVLEHYVCCAMQCVMSHAFFSLHVLCHQPPQDPYFMRNHLGSYECKLCLTIHIGEGSYLAHTQGKRHQENLARRGACAV